MAKHGMDSDNNYEKLKCIRRNAWKIDLANKLAVLGLIDKDTTGELSIHIRNGGVSKVKIIKEIG